MDVSIYLQPSHYSSESVSPGALVEARGGIVGATIQKTHPSLSQLSFYLEPLSFTPRLAGSEGLEVALGLDRVELYISALSPFKLLSDQMQPSHD